MARKLTAFERIERELIKAERDSLRACMARAVLPMGSSRARTTSAVARWWTLAEYRDKLIGQYEAAGGNYSALREAELERLRKPKPKESNETAHPCVVCDGSGFNGNGSGYGDVCGGCGGLKYLPQSQTGVLRMPEPKKERSAQLYNVDIWNTEGDVVKHFREISADEVDEVRDRYVDEPWLTVVAEESR